MSLPTHRCHACGATSYRPILARDEHGAMRPSGRYRCTGCAVVFEQVREWRTGSATAPAELIDFSPTVPMSLHAQLA
jgi:coenzyme F420-reducing hydrogenase beta subunit